MRGVLGYGDRPCWSRLRCVVAVAVLFGGAVSVAVTAADATRAAGQERSSAPSRPGIAIPAYLSSDDLRSWETIVRLRNTPRAGTIRAVVLNPRSGPNVRADPGCDGVTPPDPGPQTGPNLTGRRKDDPYVPTIIRDDPPLVIGSTTYVPVLEEQFRRRAAFLTEFGIRTFGYVWANANGAAPGCRRTAEIITDEIATYRKVYGLTSVFLDDSSPACGAADEALRHSVLEVVRAQQGQVVANVGREAESCVARSADIVVNFEQTASTYLATETTERLRRNATTLRSANPNVRIWHLVHGASKTDADEIARRLAGLGIADLLYVTDDRVSPRGCDVRTSPWDSLYGSWPLVRADRPECASRVNDSGRSFEDVVRSITVRRIQERPSPPGLSRRSRVPT